MSITLNFAVSLNYDTLNSGITIPIRLYVGQDEVAFSAKLDTGSSHCIFEGKHGERLGLNIESGSPLFFSTATGRFLAYGHDLTLSVLGIEHFVTVYFIAEEGIQRNVLGRNGWLNLVQLGLIDYEGKLFLSPYGATAS